MNTLLLVGILWLSCGLITELFMTLFIPFCIRMHGDDEESVEIYFSAGRGETYKTFLFGPIILFVALGSILIALTIVTYMKCPRTV